MKTEELTRRGFLVHEIEGDLRLVHPSRSKFAWADDELRFRSVLLDRAGNVVSTGWPKFFNQGESAEHDAAIAEELRSGRAVITHKHDGSLAIRSVLPDGRVLFRTRGSADGGEYGRRIEAVARRRYPSLLDPTFFPDGSLLFEYVAADNLIVVRYPEDDLIFLGAANHAPTVRYLAFDDLRRLAHAHQLNLVETYDWAEAGAIDTVLDLVRGWDRAEGVVVRSADGQTLLKIKSAWYFAQHALRWHMTYESIVRFCVDGAIQDVAAMEAALTQAGWDFELISVARGHFATYAERRAEADRITGVVRNLVEALPESGDERARRKAFALSLLGPNAKPELRRLSPFAFFAYDGKWSALEAALLRNVILAR